jgi:hypothetical protein
MPMVDPRNSSFSERIIPPIPWSADSWRQQVCKIVYVEGRWAGFAAKLLRSNYFLVKPGADPTKHNFSNFTRIC